jgi:hypothetical protein
LSLFSKGAATRPLPISGSDLRSSMARSNTIANGPIQLVCVKDKDLLGINPVATPVRRETAGGKGKSNLLNLDTVDGHDMHKHTTHRSYLV